ncbi:hypothetical protein PVAND_013389 [Polypedilum vanderplanki]|uniref:Peptidase S1 domain-containing protein n=1 Tax=Polypedilum vanderplanki TaxID=319348 RepID=A0A9J6CQI7_POLVA|nr:hypothetical protein PVAND_013389 [Polypedilum vanderplanki]
MKHLILIFCTFYSTFAQVNRQIIGGTTTSILNFPYLAGVYSPGPFFTCGGAIINFRSVLTAAHCILYPPHELQINAGATRQDGRDGTFHRVSHTFIHPNYQGQTHALISDIAIIRIIFPFNFGTRIRPISLGSSSAIQSNVRVQISGWGYVDPNGPISDSLQTLEMMTISNNLCSTLVQNTNARGWITNEKICAVGQQSNSGICSGDSGSPLVLRNTVIGITSWTVRPCGQYPSVFIRVSNHLSWIRENL